MTTAAMTIICAAAMFLLLRVMLKKSIGFSLTFTLLTVAAINIDVYKPLLDNVGAALGTNTVLTISAIMMLVLLFLKVPVFISVLCASMLYFIFNPGINQIIFGQKTILGVENNALLAIPFFVCQATFMNYTGVSDRMFDFCAMMAGRMPGGLAQVNVVLSAIMGGMSGSNLADAASDAKYLVPQMVRKGFSNEFSSVVSATSAMITPLIPPGIAMILYGCIADVSIGKLFVSGLGVGVTLCIAQMILVHFISIKRGYQPIRTTRLTGEQFVTSLKPAILPLCLPIIIMGSIRFGICTATEAGAIATVYSILLGILYKELKPRFVLQACKETAATTASIMLIVSAASIFSWVLTKERVPQQLTEWIVSVCPNKWAFLIAVNILVLIAGMFIEGNATMIVLVPLLAPVAAQYGIDEIHFAMVYIFNNAIGALSPPMGTLMFVVCGITKCKTKDFIKEAVPFYIMLVIVLFLLTFFPIFTTGLVNLVY